MDRPCNTLPEFPYSDLNRVFRTAMNRNTVTTFLALLFFTAATALAASVAPEPARDTIKRSFTVRPGGNLVVDIDFGNLIVESSNDSKVHVEIERRTDLTDDDDAKKMLARHEWSIDQDGNDVVVESRFDRETDGWLRRGRRSNLRIRVTVTVPREYNVEFKTGAGNVEIADIRGSVDGTTGAGNITVGEIEGVVDIRSGSGNVDIEGVDGSVEVMSGAGNVTLGYVTGEVRANTGAGNITARITEQPTASSNIESGAGNVTVYLGDRVGVDVDAHAAVGSAECDFGLRVSGKWMSKSFEGEVNGGGPALTLRSGVGSVSLKRL
jgi:hypothetical protein